METVPLHKINPVLLEIEVKTSPLHKHCPSLVGMVMSVHAWRPVWLKKSRAQRSADQLVAK